MHGPSDGAARSPPRSSRSSDPWRTASTGSDGRATHCSRCERRSSWSRTFQWAPVTAWDAIRLGAQGIADARGIYWTVDLLLTAIVLVSLAVRWRTLPRTYLVYSLATILVILSYPLPERPLLSAPRFLIVVFPAFWGLATKVRGRWLVPIAVRLRPRIRRRCRLVHELGVRLLRG